MDGLVCSARAEQPACVRTPPACLPTVRAPAPRGSREGEEAGRQGMSPPFHRFVEPGESQCSRCISQMERSKPKGGRSLALEPGNSGSEPRWCAQSHRHGGEPPAPGTPVTSWLPVPRGPPGPLQAHRAQVVSGRMEGSGQAKLPAPRLLGRQQFLQPSAAFMASLFYP